MSRSTRLLISLTTVVFSLFTLAALAQQHGSMHGAKSGEKTECTETQRGDMLKKAAERAESCGDETSCEEGTGAGKGKLMAMRAEYSGSVAHNPAGKGAAACEKECEQGSGKKASCQECTMTQACDHKQAGSKMISSHGKGKAGMGHASSCGSTCATMANARASSSHGKSAHGKMMAAQSGCQSKAGIKHGMSGHGTMKAMTKHSKSCSQQKSCGMHKEMTQCPREGKMVAMSGNWGKGNKAGCGEEKAGSCETHTNK